MDYGACCRHSRMYGTWITAHVVGYSWMYGTWITVHVVGIAGCMVHGLRCML